MNIDWSTLIEVVNPLISLTAGGLLTEFFRRKPRLFTFIGHVSAFNLQNTNPPVTIHTHSVVVSNAGRLPARNVRLSHNILPLEFEVVPSRHYLVEKMPKGDGGDIVFPSLLPKEQVTISYLYFPPLTWGQINGSVRSDEGFAKVLNVLPTPQPPAWLMRLLYVLLFVGVASTIYAGIDGFSWISHTLTASGKAS